MDCIYKTFLLQQSSYKSFQLNKKSADYKKKMYIVYAYSSSPIITKYNNIVKMYIMLILCLNQINMILYY